MPITFLDEEEGNALPVTPTKRKITFLDEGDDINKEEEIGTIEGIANAARNAFDSSRQAMDVVGGVTPEEAQNIAKIEFDKKSRKLAPGYDEYQKAEGWDAAWAFAKNPIEVTSNIIAEGLAGSLPALGAGLAAGGVGAAIGAPTGIGAPIGFTAGQVAGTFAGSLATEYGGKVLEELQGEGMDISDPNSIQTFFGNEELMGKVRDKALTRGVPVAAFDAISAGIGGKLGRVFGTKVITEGEKIIGKQFATKTGEALTELGVQSGLGAVGEVAGALAIGEPIEGKAVFGEAVGEFGTGGLQVLTGRIADKRAMAKAREDAKIKAASDLSTTLEENNAPLTAKVITTKTATSIEQDKLAAQLDEELSIQEAATAAAQQQVTQVTQQPTIDATQKIIKQQGVRQEPQDGTQIGATTEAGVSRSILGATRSEEEGQVDSTIFDLQSVANNTATREQISSLSLSGLVDIRRGQAIINEDGEGILAQAQAPLPKLTPEARAAEVEAAPVTPTPAEPIIGEEPQTSPIVGEQVTGTTPVEQVAATQIAEEPIISEKPQTSEIVGVETPTIVEQEQVAPEVTIEEAADLGYTQRDPADVRVFKASRITNESLTNHLEKQGFREGDIIETPTGNAELYVSDSGFAYSWKPKKGKGRDGVIKDPVGGIRIEPVTLRDPNAPAMSAKVSKTQPPKGYFKEGGKYIFKAGVTEQPVGAATPVAEAAQATAPAPSAALEPTEIETDPVRIQEIKNSIQEGNLILRTGKFNGKKLSPEKLASVQRSVTSSLAKLGETPAVTEATAPEVAPIKKPSPIESFKGNIKNSGFKYITYSDFRKAKKTEDWENEGGVTIDESYYPTAVVGDTSVAFTTNGLSLYKGRVEVSYEADVDASGNNIFTIERIVTPEGKRGMGSASKALSEVTSSADKAGLTLQLEPAAVKPLIKKGGKGLTSKQLVDWYKRNGFVQKFEGSDLILIRKPASTTPAVSETITEPAISAEEQVVTEREAAPAEAPAPEVGDIVAVDRKNNTEFALVKGLLPERPDMFSIGIRLIGSNQPFESGGYGHNTSKDSVMKRFFEKERSRLQDIEIKNQYFQNIINEEEGRVSAVEAKESEKKQQEQEKQRQFNEEKAAYEDAISQVKIPTGKSETMRFTAPDGSDQAFESKRYGDVGIRKVTSGKNALYNVDHWHSGLRIMQFNSLSEAKKFTQAIIASGADISKKDIQESELEKLRPIARYFRSGEVVPSLPSQLTPAVSETITEPVPVENVVGKKVTGSMGALPQKATQAREELQGYTPIFKIGDFYEFIGEEAGLSGSTIVGTGKSARSSLPYHQVSKLQEIANKTGKPIAIIANTKVAEVITPAVSEAPAPAGIAVGNRVKLGKSPQTYIVEEVLPQSESEIASEEQSYLIRDENTGKVSVSGRKRMYLVGGKKARKMAAEVIPNQEAVAPIPEANRYTYEEAVKLVDSYFDKEGIPEGIVIVNNTTDPDLEMKAGYFVDRGQIVINLAYIAKGESLSDIISHELGHFIFSDPQFQADFKAFWDLMTPEEQADADRIINQFYNKETGAIQMEEKQVRAFMQLIQDSKAMPKWRQLLDSIKRWINEKLGTNFLVTDRGALSVLAAAHKRFKSGERIIREIDSGVLKSAETAQDAEYLAAVERGDMETAQRMVDEAARKAGYTTRGTHRTNKKFTQFDRNFVGKRDSGFIGDGFYFSRGGVEESNEGYGKFAIEAYLNANLLDLNPSTANIDAIRQAVIDQVNERRVSKGFNMLTESDPQYQRIVKDFTFDKDYEGFGGIASAIKKSSYVSKIAQRMGYDGAFEKSEIVIFNPEQIKSADAVTYDDAGNVIPLSQRFRTTSPDIRRMAAEPKRERVGGKERGEAITTPEGIIEQSKAVIRNKFFDGTEVSDERTLQAWNYIEQFLDIESGASNELAGLVNDVVDQETNSDTRMGASLLHTELGNYAAKLADQGDMTMLPYIIRRINRMRLDNLAGDISEYARGMRARQELDINGFNTLKTENESKVERTAATLFGTSKPSEDQVKIVQDAINAAEDETIGNPEDVAAEIEKVEKRTGRKVIKAVDEKIKENIEGRRRAALEKQKSRPRTPYGVEGQAQSIINQFSTLLSDVPTFTEKQENRIKTIVQQDLRQRPNMGRKQPWTSQLTAKLIDAGVNETQAQTIAELTWRQHEIKAMDRELKELQTAAEKGSLAVIVQRIKDTPLAMQQEPNWMQGVIREYLVEAGLSEKAAGTAAKLYESVISERFAEAKQKAFEAALNKSAPWNNFLSRNVKLGKDALKKIQEAIRTGVLDPTQTTESIIAKQNGWSGFSKEQLTRIVQLDDILSDSNTNQVTKAEAMSELNKIIVKAKMPVRFKDAISSFYVAQALSGIPTFTVNIASPTFFAIRNLAIDVARYAATDPKNIPVAFQSFMNSMQNWKDNSLYAFKNQIYMSGEIEYMQGQNVLRELFDKGMGQWKKGEYANGMANMLVGMMQITGRVLSSLDQGAIAMMESQNIPRYALDAMASNKKIPKDKRKEIANIALYGRSLMRQDLIESGMSPERAGVLADLQMRSELMVSLSEYGISKTEVLDASLNDALQSVGRNRVITTEGFKQARDNLRDAGITSGLAIGFLENLASNANRGGQAQQIFARMLYGFALVPARVFSTALWFSPVGFIRLGVDSLLKKAGIESRYAMSLATDLQYKQRVYESIAGTVLLGALASLVKSSTDDEDDELPFKIVATGNGPNYTTDPQYYDSWNKRNKPGELSMYFGKTKFTLNIGRGGEAVSIPFMIAGAFDDWNIKSKQNAAKNSPKDLEMAAEVLGSAFYAYAQRGPWAAFGRPLFDAKKQDKLIPDLFGKAAYLGKTFVPILGSSLSRNISDFINDPIDKSSVQGAIYANTPVIGPMFGTKALNALGQPIRGDDWNDRLFKIGVPLVFSFPKNTPENDLNILILKKGDGPAIPTRTNAQKKFGDVITDKEFEIYVREYGRVVSDKMFKNRKRLETMESKNYIKELDKYVNGYSIDGINVSGASDMAVRAVKRSRNE